MPAGTDGARPALNVHPGQLRFGEVLTGSTVRSSFYISNTGLVPLQIDTLIITAGFETREIPRLFFAIASSPTIVPGGFAKVTVGFTAPTSTGKALGRLRIFMRQPLAPVEEVLLTASVVDVASVPLSEGTEIRLLEARRPRIVQSENIAEFPLTFEVPPLAPTRVRARAVLDADGVFPEGTTVRLSSREIQLGVRQLVDVIIGTPLPYPTGDYGFRLVGQVETGREVLTVQTPFIDSVPPDRLPLAQECECSNDSASLSTKDRRVVQFPDPDPQEGSRPSQNPVAQVVAQIDGPGQGGCCLGNGAEFRLSLAIDSRVGLANDHLTAFLLWAGLCGRNLFSLSSRTNGALDAISLGPGSEVGCEQVVGNPASIGRVEVQALHDTGVDCDLREGSEWSCSTRGEAVTRLTLLEDDPGSGSTVRWAIEVHWKASVTGTQCRVQSTAASVSRIVFLRRDQVYDPARDEWVYRTGDSDGDGVSNYAEVLTSNDPAGS